MNWLRYTLLSHVVELEDDRFQPFVFSSMHTPGTRIDAMWVLR